MKDKKKYIATIILCAFLVLSVPIALSETVIKCIDNSTLIRNTTYNFYILDEEIGNFTISIPKICDYGCDTITNSCSPSQLNLTLYAIIFIFGFLLAIGILIKLFKRR